MAKMRFWIPENLSQNAEARKMADKDGWWRIDKYGENIINLQSHHEVKLPNRTVVIRGDFHTDDPKDVRVLIADPVVRCERTDAVVLGILTLAELQEMGYAQDAATIAKIEERLRAAKVVTEDGKPNLEHKTEAAKEAEKVPSLPELPPFDTMYRDQIFNWAVDDSPEGTAVRGCEPIPVASTYSKTRMVDRIMKELEKRGDPRLTARE